ncbi:MAG: prepilin peptidase [Candidatus Limnocylindrales bacterium]
MLTPIAVLLGLLGASWGFVADRIGARWPAHDDGGGVRPLDWRTPVAVVTGALALGALTSRFAEPVPAVVLGAYLVALVLLLATDLDQRLLPDVITLPAIPLALAFDLLGLNPLVTPGDLPSTILVAIAVPGLMYLFSIPFGTGAFGQGDVKLLVSVGLLAGPLRMFSGVVYGALLAGVVIVVLLIARRITLKTYIPFGPFLIFGALWAILVIP